MWANHFQKMAQDGVPYQRTIYTNLQPTSTAVSLISPTEAVVQQARNDIKRTLSQPSIYKPKKVKVMNQFGEGRTQKRVKTKSSKKRSSSKGKIKRKSKKKVTKRRHSSGVKSKKRVKSKGRRKKVSRKTSKSRKR